MTMNRLSNSVVGDRDRRRHAERLDDLGHRVGVADDQHRCRWAAFSFSTSRPSVDGDHRDDRPAALAVGSAVCCVRLNSVANDRGDLGVLQHRRQRIRAGPAGGRQVRIGAHAASAAAIPARRARRGAPGKSSSAPQRPSHRRPGSATDEQRTLQQRRSSAHRASDRLSRRRPPERAASARTGCGRQSGIARAPATSASAPDDRCCGVAPARIARAITIAATGITGPKRHDEDRRLDRRRRSAVRAAAASRRRSTT